MDFELKIVTVRIANADRSRILGHDGIPCALEKRAASFTL
jgi:hypothetical protein